MEGSKLALGRGGSGVGVQVHDGLCGVTVPCTGSPPGWLQEALVGMLLLLAVRFTQQPAASHEEEEEEEHASLSHHGVGAKRVLNQERKEQHKPHATVGVWCPLSPDHGGALVQLSSLTNHPSFISITPEHLNIT